MRTLASIVVGQLEFLAQSPDDVVSLEDAVRLMESIIAELQGATDAERTAVLQVAAARLAEAGLRHAAADVIEFWETFPEAFNLVRR